MCTKDTTSHIKYLVNDLEHTGDTRARNEVTAGPYVPPTTVDEDTKILLKILRHPNHASDDTISNQLATHEYVSRWSNVCKTISSSASSRNFGHYKNLRNLKTMYQKVFTAMSNIPYHTEYSAKHW